MALAGAGYAPPLGPAHVLHLDDRILGVAKPSGLLTVPGKDPSLADCLIARLGRVFPGILLVHRLDRDTSGVMVFARDRKAQRHLGRQFEKRRVAKRYVAVVAGRVAGEAGEVDLPLRADWPNRPRQMVDPVAGRAALTRWEVAARGPDATRVVLRPETGRSHQLRVHMACLGHPVLGDPLYGDPESAPRLMLHAAELTLRHPDDGRFLTLAVPPPF